jgi:hypothetical protein
VNLKELIDKLSKEYRKTLKEINELKDGRFKIIKEMEDKQITHKRYLNLIKDKEKVERDIIIKEGYAAGVHESREILLYSEETI